MVDVRGVWAVWWVIELNLLLSGFLMSDNRNRTKLMNSSYVGGYRIAESRVSKGYSQGRFQIVILNYNTPDNIYKYR